MSLSNEKPDYAINLIKTLLEVILTSKESTMQGLTHEIRNAEDYIIEKVKETGILKGKTNLFLKSTANIFR